MCVRTFVEWAVNAEWLRGRLACTWGRDCLGRSDQWLTEPLNEHNTTQVLFDLGCGDGRVCIEAAKATGASAVGECDITTCVYAVIDRVSRHSISWTNERHPPSFPPPTLYYTHKPPYPNKPPIQGVEIEPRLIDKFRARLQRATPPLREGQVEVLQGGWVGVG